MPGPPIIVGSSSSYAGTSLETLRHRLLETLGYFATGTVTTEAAGLEGDRYVISDQIQSDQAPPEQLDGLFLYVRGGDEARTPRRIVNGSFDGPLGAAVVDRAYASGPLAAATPFEIGVLPGEKWFGAEGANHIINLALEQLPLIDFLPITIALDDDGQVRTQYSLAGYPWPIKKVHAVIYPRTSTTHEARREMPNDWTFDQDAELPMLSFTTLRAKVGDVIEVKVEGRPAHTRIKSGGTWGDSTTGLSGESDACLYDAATVIDMARPIALERLALLLPRASKERAELSAEARVTGIDAAFTRFYSRFKGSGAQKAGATYGRR